MDCKKIIFLYFIEDISEMSGWPEQLNFSPEGSIKGKGDEGRADRRTDRISIFRIEGGGQVKINS